MVRQGVMKGLVAMCVAAMVLVAAPAFAQLGSLQGRVVDEAGKPVPGADVNLQFVGDLKLSVSVKTDNNGRWTRAGLHAVGGRWTITATKDGLTGAVANIQVSVGSATTVEDITIRKGGARVLTPEEAKRNAEGKKVLEEVNAALTANDQAAALAKLGEAVTKIDKCTDCYIRMGDIYASQKNSAKAEESYKAALAIDEKAFQAWDGLAVLYNADRKFDLAADASAKSIALQGSTGGPADATSVYNAGVILSNQRKMPEAKAMFERAIQMNPNMAEAHYQLAMALLNENKMADAVKSLDTYLKIAPTGANAETAKLLLEEAKKLAK